MRRAIAITLVLFALGVRARADVPNFEAKILPILERSCVECHRAPYQDDRGRTRKPKGGVRLDGRGWIEAGNEDGPILVAGNAEESLVYALTVLDPDDEDRMPNEADPLAADEIELLRAWIDGGADFGAWIGAPGPDVDLAPAMVVAESGRIATLRRLGSGLAPTTEEQRHALAALPARVEAVFPGSPLLRIDALAEFADADLAHLGPVAERIGILDLGRSRVSDVGLATIATMRRLVRLDLHETKVGDAGIARLAGLLELRSVNLFGTGVTDAAVPTLADLPALESVHVWRSAITEEGAEALRQKRPGVRVSSRLILPGDVGAESEGGGR